MMTQKLLVGVMVCTALGGGLATRTTFGQAQPQATSDEFQQAVLPVLSKNCLGCHSDKQRAGTVPRSSGRRRASGGLAEGAR
jgi:hypothetical protein